MARAEASRPLTFVPQADLSILDPVWTTTYPTRDHAFLVFDTLYAERRMMMIGMHPQLIGQPSRLKVLEGLIDHVSRHSDVWIGRCDEIVEHLRPKLELAK